MAYEQPGFKIGFLAADVDMSNAATWQFAPVWIGPAQNIQGHGNGGAGGGAALVAKGAITYPAAGVLQNSPIQGESGAVVTNGVSKCIATGTIALGVAIKLVAGGAAAAATGDFRSGYALEAASAGDIFSVYLTPMGTM